MTIRFRDRTEAGQQLATKLSAYAHRADVLVIGLPRGGVPVAAEVATALHAPLDICLVRKLGVPGHQELAMGAIASGGVRVLNDDLLDWLGISDQTIDEVAARELRELERRDHKYRGDRPPPDLRDRTVVLVDDGLATGSTMRAAIAAIRQQSPQRIVVAVPVGASETCEEIRRETDEVVCLRTPDPLYAIGLWYENFAQTTDEEVCKLLENNLSHRGPKASIGGK
ncbi:MAG: phosphoribosyltransferase [Thermosynechococcaceae cyanobacterium]